MTGEDSTPEQIMRRRVLAREGRKYKSLDVFLLGFVTLYVVSATVSQITMATLVSYLIAGAS